MNNLESEVRPRRFRDKEESTPTGTAEGSTPSESGEASSSKSAAASPAADLPRAVHDEQEPRRREQHLPKHQHARRAGLVDQDDDDPHLGGKKRMAQNGGQKGPDGWDGGSDNQGASSRPRAYVREEKYRAEKKSLQILLSSTQAGPGRKVKQEQEEISRNHVPRRFLGSVRYSPIATTSRYFYKRV